VSWGQSRDKAYPQTVDRFERLVGAFAIAREIRTKL
jgi:hypothetical protein